MGMSFLCLGMGIFIPGLLELVARLCFEPCSMCQPFSLNSLRTSRSVIMVITSYAYIVVRNHTYVNTGELTAKGKAWVERVSPLPKAKKFAEVSNRNSS